jgi:hypothetical protein
MGLIVFILVFIFFAIFHLPIPNNWPILLPDFLVWFSVSGNILNETDSIREGIIIPMAFNLNDVGRSWSRFGWFILTLLISIIGGVLIQQIFILIRGGGNEKKYQYQNLCHYVRLSLCVWCLISAITLDYDEWLVPYGRTISQGKSIDFTKLGNLSDRKDPKSMIITINYLLAIYLFFSTLWIQCELIDLKEARRRDGAPETLTRDSLRGKGH